MRVTAKDPFNRRVDGKQETTCAVALLRLMLLLLVKYSVQIIGAVGGNWSSADQQAFGAGHHREVGLVVVHSVVARSIVASGSISSSLIVATRQKVVVGTFPSFPRRRSSYGRSWNFRIG